MSEAASPYTRMAVGNLSNHDKVCCSFCGSVVLERMWDDHVSWHETLDLQATAIIRRSLTEIAENLED